MKKKINKAFCPPNEVKDNPCMDYLKHIVFEKQNEFEVKRPEKYGGDKLVSILFHSFHLIYIFYYNTHINFFIMN